MQVKSASIVPSLLLDTGENHPVASICAWMQIGFFLMSALIVCRSRPPQLYPCCVTAAFHLGTPSPISPCSFVVNSKNKRQGVILTPTYPGIYPKGMTCKYLFHGQVSQRVRLEFRDFDLFFGGPQ